MPSVERIPAAPALNAQREERRTQSGAVLTVTVQPTSGWATAPVHIVAGLRVAADRGPAFACGHWYDPDSVQTFGRVASLSFPYNTYRRVRARPIRADGRLYRHAADLKFPLLATYCPDDGRWHGLAFEPVAPAHGGWPPICFSLAQVGVTRELVVGCAPRMHATVARHAWFGLGSRRVHSSLETGPGEPFEIRIAELAADEWWDLIESAATELPFLPRLDDVPPASDGRVRAAADRAWRFLARAEDRTHGALVHLLRRDAPGQVSATFKHSHVTSELHALELCARIKEANSLPAAERYEYLRHWCFRAGRTEERGETRLWHTTTRLGARGLESFTHHGAGFVGFPGGQATNARHLAEAYQRTGDETLADAALATARWVLQHQRRDGAWPTTVPLRGEVRLKPVDTDRANLAATAESVRALLAAYAIESDRAWLDAADRGFDALNREHAFWHARGYLRDAAPDEPDGLTAECAIQANLDRARFGPGEAFLSWAKRWAWYAVQWTRPLAPDPRGAWAVDGLGHTITPRIDVWGALLLGHAWARLGGVTGEAFWRNLAWRQLALCLNLQEPDGGLAETWWYDWPGGLTPVPIESTFLALAGLDLVLDFIPDWRPSCPPAAGARPATVAERVAGPADLVVSLACEHYECSVMPGQRTLERLARTGPPGGWATQMLGALTLLTGGPRKPQVDSATTSDRPRSLAGQTIVENACHIIPLRIAMREETREGTVPIARIEGGRAIALADDTLRVTAADGSHWRVHADGSGNVLCRADGVLDFGRAADWATDAAEWRGAVTFAPIGEDA